MNGTASDPGMATTQKRTAAAEPSALRQIRESAQALLAAGKVDEVFEFFVSALDAVLRKTRDLEPELCTETPEMPLGDRQIK